MSFSFILRGQGLASSRRLLSASRLYSVSTTKPLHKGKPVSDEKATPTKEPLTAEEEQMKVAELMSRSRKPTVYSLVSQTLPLLDVSLPPKWSDLPSGMARLRATIPWLKHHLNNKAANVLHLRTMSQFSALPGIRRPSKWSYNMFRTSSTSKSSWLAPMRELALQRYIQFNEAQAGGDSRTLTKVCRQPLLGQAQERVRSRGNARFVWKYHGEASPTRCISVRTMTDYDLDLDPEKAAAAQILVKFDTYQSLAIYDYVGKLLKGDPNQKNRVVEYLVLERKLWDMDGWTLKTQMYPIIPK